MTGIKSTVEMVYDARGNKSGMIEIEVLGWTYEPIGKRYATKVVDYAITTQPDESIQKQMIAQKDVYYSKEQVDALFSGLGNSIDITESFSDEMDNLISKALLLVTQQEPIYRVASTGVISVAEEWILKTE